MSPDGKARCDLCGRLVSILRPRADGTRRLRRHIARLGVAGKVCEGSGREVDVRIVDL